MSWPLASFVLLALALAAGFAWYERARPSAKLLALVATLAALAALGRVAFAPIPSVKPTTDIVLIAGYALGGAPGFVVGSVAALASNVFFGQGPFTPWQMAGWGAVGVFGAVLARLFGRELGRWSLAGACAIAGLLYGSFLDLHLWVLYSAHSWDEYLLVAGRGVPFNIAAAAGNVAFCLAFGPLLVRALDRYRDRLDVTWHPLPTGAARGRGWGRAPRAPRGLARAPPAPARPAPARPARSRPSRCSSRSPASPPARARRRRGTRRRQRPIARDHVPRARAERGRRLRQRPRPRLGPAVHELGGHRPRRRRARSQPRAARRALGSGLHRAQHRPLQGHRRRRARDPRAALREALGAERRRAQPRHRAHPQAPPQRLVRRPRQPDGVRDPRAARRRAWRIRPHASAPPPAGSRASTTPTAASTSPAGAARAASTTRPPPSRGSSSAGKRGTRTVARGAAFLAARQNADGGMPLSPGGASNAQSTAWAVQALVAAGRDPDRVRRRGARSPLAYIRSLQTSSGAVRYSRTSIQITRLGHRAGADRPCPQAIPDPVRAVRPGAPPRFG